MTTVLFHAGPYPVDDGLGGIGLRLWESAQVLADAGHRVTIAAPRPSGFTHEGVTVTTRSWGELLAGHRVLVTTDLPDTRLLLAAHAAGLLLVAENAPPIEHLHYDALAGPDGQDLYADTVARWRLQLMLADHFLVRSEAERASTLGALVATGRLSAIHHRAGPALDHLLSLVPLGYNRHSAQATAEAPIGPPVDIVWSGGAWEYCHPSPLLPALLHARGLGRELTLRLLYEPGPAFRAQVHALQLEGQVQLPEGPLRHRDRDRMLNGARALAITGSRTAENQTCHRLRLRDTALYRLPVVADPYGSTGEAVAALGIGVVADPADPKALAVALLAATDDGPARTGHLAALDLAAPRFDLERHLQPLLHLIAEGRPAPDRDDPAHRAAVARLLADTPALTTSSPAII
ncbi:hypothetical protein [Streptomyces sp. CBMA123]|uniref:hypothetical protein n=1 Tax=Streptomyces sp. CBMA123 TaxID=1896313 RepID=UPI001CB842EB|nr:hypothetical protein [Streptomyces sp. CBMA123]MBD0692476.1 hypothetical protein [Streptomyces sp. CBMA123]